MEKHEIPEKEHSIGSDTIEPPNEPQNATKEDGSSTTADVSNPEPTAQKNDEVDDWEYVTGVKLFLAIGTVTLACFIMLLDTSIVATVIESPQNFQTFTKLT